MVASLATSLHGELAWVFGGYIEGMSGQRIDWYFRFHCPGKPEDGGCEWVYHHNGLFRKNWATAITF